MKTIRCCAVISAMALLLAGRVSAEREAECNRCLASDDSDDVDDSMSPHEREERECWKRVEHDDAVRMLMRRHADYENWLASEDGNKDVTFEVFEQKYKDGWNSRDAQIKKLRLESERKAKIAALKNDVKGTHVARTIKERKDAVISRLMADCGRKEIERFCGFKFGCSVGESRVAIIEDGNDVDENGNGRIRGDLLRPFRLFDKVVLDFEEDMLVGVKLESSKKVNDVSVASNERHAVGRLLSQKYGVTFASAKLSGLERAAMAAALGEAGLMISASVDSYREKMMEYVDDRINLYYVIHWDEAWTVSFEHKGLKKAICEVRSSEAKRRKDKENRDRGLILDAEAGSDVL